MLRTIVVSLLAATAFSAAAHAAPPTSLRLQTDEAVAALRIVDTLALHREPSVAAWTALYTSDGYRRLKRREAAMGRGFTDSSFAAFLRSDSLIERRQSLRESLRAWQRLNTQAAATQALAWLPRGARIKATVYLLIKPRTNSFVFEANSDPAIMLYLDPAKPVAQFTSDVVHELHHIGYASACDSGNSPGSTVGARVRMWLSAFGEGFAMLAASGSLNAHPHAASPADVRARWDHDVANFDTDLRAVQDFARGALDGTIVSDSIASRAMQFFGVQGPWYTVGWKMAVVIGQERGKPALIAAMCRPLDVLTTFNSAAAQRAKRTGERLATWDPALVEQLRSTP